MTFLPNFEKSKVKENALVDHLTADKPRYQSELIPWQPPATIMDQSLGTLLQLWELFQFTHDQPLPHTTNNVGRVYPEFLPSFNIV